MYFYILTPGAGLLEIRPQASHMQFLESPSTLFVFFSKDPHQLTNLVGNSDYAKSLEQARKLLAEWTEQTGDSIPKNPTPHRHDPPQIVDGKIIPPKKAKVRNPHAEMPGASKNAMKIDHPGPIRLP